MATISTLIADIQAVLSSEEGVDIPPHLLEEFGEACKAALKKQLTDTKRLEKGTRLSISSLGTPDRKLYYQVHTPKTRGDITADLRMKFLYGDILESILITLSKLSGHEVTHEQERVQLTTKDGSDFIAGSKDCHIDGCLVDVKSASSFSYSNKFDTEALKNDDPFGYVMQLHSYKAATTSTSLFDTPKFFVADKQHGLIKLVNAPEPPVDPQERLEHVLLMLDSSDTPPRCYTDIPEGKSGNMTLPVGCNYCDFKHQCWADANEGNGLRAFQYSNGVKYLTKVVREPKVEELK